MPVANGEISGSWALAFPGQGGDWAAGLEILGRHRQDPLVRLLADHLKTESWGELDPLDTRNAQPIIYTAGLLAASELDTALVTVAMGHSLGEITAAAWAAAISPEAGLELMVARAQLGSDAQQSRPASMAVVMRLDTIQLEWLRRAVVGTNAGILEVAVKNSSTQHVLTGDAALVQIAVREANAAGAVARLLPIGGGYHCSILAPQVDSFRLAVETAVSRDPSIPVIGSTMAGPWRTRADLVELLTRSLVLPVDWPMAVRTAVAEGARAIVDAGPGDTLTRLAKYLPSLPADGSDRAGRR